MKVPGKVVLLLLKSLKQNVVEHAEMQVPRQDELKHDVDIDLHETKTMPQSPRARRSYKTLHDESSLLETRRTRASSVDKSLTESPRRTRTSSVDKSLIESPRRTRASSVDKSLIESPRRTRASSVERSEDVSMKDDAADDETKTLPQSPKARRSYKRSYDESAALEPRRTRASSVEKCRTESPSIEPRRTRASSVDKSIRISSVGASPAIRISSETSSSESPSTSVSESPKQSPRLLQVNRRKPLSRQVLEHNAFSALQSSKFVSKEVIVTKKDSTVITETSADSTKVISLEIESQVSEKISENQRSLRLTDSVRKEERIEHAEKNSEGDDSFLSQLADEWIKGRKVGKNCSDDESEVKDEVDTEENEPTDVTGSSTVDKNYLEANKNSGDNQSEVESDSIQLEFSTEESKPAGEVPSSTVDNNYLEARKKSGDNESEVEDKVDTEEIKPVDVMLSSAVDDDNPEESGQDEIEESTQLSEKESSDVAAQSKPTKLLQN
ncbi:unnamed protein product [Acanthoscelides obtectus]|uniref:Uncharacterized protein n=1 Tax=Acanthoscelides obtectus TaxID=200917 RepID=A0A9P0QAB4_ACAOB|nr:unnamed protein product [Acanthoscelides obtectus]CAK1629809.1 hypothetical protein AOBTE_LOCUS5969 [Acanthoscelides obtectus]